MGYWSEKALNHVNVTGAMENLKTGERLKRTITTELDIRFVEFVRERKLSNGPYAYSDPALSGSMRLVHRGAIRHRSWHFDSERVQMLWECWQHGHEAGVEDAQ
jgi:hypothetical protein